MRGKIPGRRARCQVDVEAPMAFSGASHGRDWPHSDEKFRTEPPPGRLVLTPHNWSYSAVGRALQSHCGGQRFEFA